MANKNEHTGDVDNLVQGNVSGGVHFYNDRARIRPRTRLVVMSCVLALVIASAVVLTRSDWMLSPGVAPPANQGQRSVPGGDRAAPDRAFGNEAQCLAPASPVRDDRNHYLTNFARTHDDTVAQNNQIVSRGHTRGGWVDIGGKAQDQPVAACDAKGQTVVLSIADGQLWMNPNVKDHRSSERGTPHLQDEHRRWRSEGAPPRSNGLVGVPAAARDADGALVIVARDADGLLWEKHQTSAEDDEWSEWADLPGDPVLDDPAMSQGDKGDVHIFTPVGGRTVQEHTHAGHGSGKWQLTPSAEPLSDKLAPADIRTTPAVTRANDGCLHLFAVTATGSMVTNKQTSCADGTWSDWEDWGFPAPEEGGGQSFAPKSPLAIPNAQGRIEVFALDTTNTLWETWQRDDVSDAWSGWMSLGDEVQHLMGVVLDSISLVVYGFDAEGNVQNRYQSTGEERWSPWADYIGGKNVPLHHH